jgi:hypothetical protein
MHYHGAFQSTATCYCQACGSRPAKTVDRDGDEIGPVMLSRIAKRTGLMPKEL